MASSGDGKEEASAPARVFKFPSHQSHTLALAKMCKESKAFADCVIQCDVGAHKAHRLVLGAASAFLKEVFADLPASLTEATVVVPGVKNEIVAGLLDFLYTGEMKVERADTADLQRLIEALQIDRSLIDVDAVQEEEEKEEEEEESAKDASVIEGQESKKSSAKRKLNDEEEESAKKRREADEDKSASSSQKTDD